VICSQRGTNGHPRDFCFDLRNTPNCERHLAIGIGAEYQRSCARVAMRNHRRGCKAIAFEFSLMGGVRWWIVVEHCAPALWPSLTLPAGRRGGDKSNGEKLDRGAHIRNDSAVEHIDDAVRVLRRRR